MTVSTFPSIEYVMKSLGVDEFKSGIDADKHSIIIIIFNFSVYDHFDRLVDCLKKNIQEIKDSISDFENKGLKILGYHLYEDYQNKGIYLIGERKV